MCLRRTYIQLLFGYEFFAFRILYIIKLLSSSSSLVHICLTVIHTRCRHSVSSRGHPQPLWTNQCHRPPFHDRSSSHVKEEQLITSACTQQGVCSFLCTINRDYRCCRSSRARKHIGHHGLGGYRPGILVSRSHAPIILNLYISDSMYSSKISRELKIG